MRLPMSFGACFSEKGGAVGGAVEMTRRISGTERVVTAGAVSEEGDEAA